MTKNIPGGLLSRMQGDWNQADLVKIIRPDGVIITMTGHDVAITIDMDGDGVATYQPQEFGQISAFSSKLSSPIDEAELRLLIDGTSIVIDEIRKGFYTGSVIRVGFCDWANQGDGAYHNVTYILGNIRIDGPEVLFELRGFESQLELDVSVVLTTNCRFQLGDIGCKVVITSPSIWSPLIAYTGRSTLIRDDSVGDIIRPTSQGKFWFRAQTTGTSDENEPTWPVSVDDTVVDDDGSFGGTIIWQAIFARTVVGTVDTVTSLRQFTALSIDFVNDYFAEGMITWLTGNNIGMSHRIRNDDGAGALELFSVAYETIQVGDTFIIVAGCRKAVNADCSVKFFNTWNFGGFPHVAPERITSKASTEPG